MSWSGDRDFLIRRLGPAPYMVHPIDPAFYCKVAPSERVTFRANRIDWKLRRGSPMESPPCVLRAIRQDFARCTPVSVAGLPRFAQYARSSFFAKDRLFPTEIPVVLDECMQP